MKFIAISDTHGRHPNLKLPSGDVLIHAGDISMGGQEAEVMQFLQWFSEQEFKYKILIAGNHDFYFERASVDILHKILPEGITYLNDSGTVLDGIKIWGSPVTPWFFNWAFNRHRGAPIKKHWDLIPNDTDILITHGPVLGILDKTKSGQHVGCEDLLQKVMKIKPGIHVCGHIHEAYGRVHKSGIQFINASILNERYAMLNSAVCFELSARDR